MAELRVRVQMLPPWWQPEPGECLVLFDFSCVLSAELGKLSLKGWGPGMGFELLAPGPSEP